MKLVSLAFLLATAATGPALSQEHKTIGGVVVPPDQLEEVELKCGELLGLKPTEETAPAAEAPAAGASDDVATTESAAETPVAPAATESSEGNMAADTSSDPATVTIDLETLTPEICEAGGFLAATGAISPQGTGAINSPETPADAEMTESGPEAPDALAGPGAAGED
jgi:autotransporter adhesin